MLERAIRAVDLDIRSGDAWTGKRPSDEGILPNSDSKKAATCASVTPIGEVGDQFCVQILRHDALSAYRQLAVFRYVELSVNAEVDHNLRRSALRA